MSENQIKAAVDWWANVIKGPKFDNGDKSSRGGMTMGLAMLARKAPTDEGVEKFRAELTRLLEAAKEPVWLSCDYGPGGYLADAAEVSGVSQSSFPWKTNMNLRDGKVTVAYGYQAPWETIYPPEADNASTP